MLYFISAILLITIAILFKLSKEKSNILLENKSLQEKIVSLQANIEENKSKIENLYEEKLNNVKEISAQNIENNHLVSQIDLLKDENTKLNDTIHSISQDLSLYKNNNIILNAKLETLNEKLLTQKSDLEELHKASKLEFENVANKIFEEKTNRFNELSSEKLKSILNPLSENLIDFKKQVNDVYDRESKERFSLTNEISKLKELNQKISDDANNLTNALKGDSKVQGDWGEMILERILEASGLKQGVHYFKQPILKDKDGVSLKNADTGKSMRPDIIVKYPQGKEVVIDSKVSLTAYSKMVSSKNNKDADTFFKEHIVSVKKHIDELSAKDYSAYDINSPDFVMMFIPNEPSYNLALKADPNLWEYAYSRKVVLMSPTNLIAALRMALDLWKREDQAVNIQNIIKQASNLYDKFVGFTNNFEKIGDQIESVKNTYDHAYKQLSTGSGNVIGRMIKLRDMGLVTKKKISTKLKNESLSHNEELAAIDDLDNDVDRETLKD